PASTCGVNVGLTFPRNTLAAFTATFPNTWLLASMTYQRGFCSSFLAKNVLMKFLFSSFVKRRNVADDLHLRQHHFSNVFAVVFSDLPQAPGTFLHTFDCAPFRFGFIGWNVDKTNAEREITHDDLCQSS